MKYGYVFIDWGIYKIVEFTSVKELTEDDVAKMTVDGINGPWEISYAFTKENYVRVTYADPSQNPYRNSLKPDLFPKADVYDTREEAEEKADRSCLCGAYCYYPYGGEQ